MADLERILMCGSWSLQLAESPTTRSPRAPRSDDEDPSRDGHSATVTARRSPGHPAPIWSLIVVRTQRLYWSSDHDRSMTRFL